MKIELGYTQVYEFFLENNPRSSEITVDYKCSDKYKCSLDKHILGPFNNYTSLKIGICVTDKCYITLKYVFFTYI